MNARPPPPQVTLENGGVYSSEFGDIYFQPEDGLAETQHVFIDGNDLRERFARLQPGEPFVVGELGLGTGLNLLAVIATFLRYAPESTRLHLWTCDAFPFPKEQLVAHLEAHAARWRELSDALDILLPAIPKVRPGLAHRPLGDIGTLTIWHGDASAGLEASPFLADAWFLDGFSPSANPAMWSASLLRDVAEHTHAGGTASTFTVAGDVRRGLVAAGFDIAKTPGFGRKREMLCAEMPGASAGKRRRRIAVIGAGIAGAFTAWHAGRAGHDVQIFEKAAPAAGASGNPAGLIMPRIDATVSPISLFYRDSFLYARHILKRAAPDAYEDRPGEMRPRNERDGPRWGKALETGMWHPDDFSMIGETVHFASAGLFDPQAAISAILADHRVEKMTIAPGALSEIGPDLGEFDTVVVTAGADVADLLPEMAADIGRSRGQIDWFKTTNADEALLSAGSYIAARDGVLYAGATYERMNEDGVAAVKGSDTDANADVARTLGGMSAPQHLGARVSVRATTPDKNPVFGAIPRASKAPWLIGGLGSRGLSTGPMLSAAFVQSLDRAPGPLQADIVPQLDPMRFARRREQKRQP